MPEFLSTKFSQMATQTKERFQKVCLCRDENLDEETMNVIATKKWTNSSPLLH